MFTVRRATLNDLEAFLQLRIRLFREAGDVVSDEVPSALLEATRSYFLTSLPTNRFLAWVAEAEGTLIGISGVVFLEKPPTAPNLSGREASIMNMYTLPEWRRKGVATALLQEILQFMKTNTILRVWLRTTPDGKHLYAENGFTATQDEMEWQWQGR